MKTYTTYLTYQTKKKIEIVNITQEIVKAVQQSKIQEGLCLVNAMHITSSVFINDEEQGLKEDFITWLEELAPYDPDRYQHNLTGEDNAHAQKYNIQDGGGCLSSVIMV
ncbi:MAG: YjbQ family protein [Patescibacteria group bacterium]